MKALLLLTAVLSCSPASAFLFHWECTDPYLKKINLPNKNPEKPTDAASVYDFFAYDIDGNVTSLKDRYEGKVLMIVNAASE